jgi:uncharacterized protein (UPF0276 family)
MIKELIQYYEYDLSNGYKVLEVEKNYVDLLQLVYDDNMNDDLKNQIANEIQNVIPNKIDVTFLESYMNENWISFRIWR